MRRTLQLATLLIGVTYVLGAQVIDRIVAVVNGEPVLQSQLEDAANFEALVDGREPGPADAATQKAVLQRLIDLRLIQQQLRGSSFPHSSDQELAARIAEIRRTHPDGQNDERWRALLAKAGFTEEDFAARARAQLDQMRFVDARIRPGVRVSDQEIERYYRQQYLPELRRRGVGSKPLADVRQQIEQILTEDRLNALIGNWIESLRAQASIVIRGVPGEGPTTRAEAPPREQEAKRQ